MELPSERMARTKKIARDAIAPVLDGLFKDTNTSLIIFPAMEVAEKSKLRTDDVRAEIREMIREQNEKDTGDFKYEEGEGVLPHREPEKYVCIYVTRKSDQANTQSTCTIA